MRGITIDHVTKSFGRTTAVDDVSLEIPDGEFLVLVGPSGCGKTTLLRMVAGLEGTTAGDIWMGDRRVTALPPKQRDVAMVFQDYGLYPHLTVEENLGIGLKLRRVPKRLRRERVAEVAALLSLDGLLARKPGQLSGGQQQRVAIGRAIVRQPAVYLMDEPLSNLDAKLRVQMRSELARLRERLRVTTVYVTHDQVEAMTLGDRVAVLRDGSLQQVDTARELFARPANVFVAGFIGSPEMNLVHADIDDGRLRFGGHALPLPSGADLGGRRTVIIGLRPGAFRLLSPVDPPVPASISTTAEVTELLGEEMRVMFTVAARRGGSPETGREDDEPLVTDLTADRDPGEVTAFTASIAPDDRVAPHAPITLVVDVKALHFFDPTTGLAIGAESQQRSSPAALPDRTRDVHSFSPGGGG